MPKEPKQATQIDLLVTAIFLLLNRICACAYCNNHGYTTDSLRNHWLRQAVKVLKSRGYGVDHLQGIKPPIEKLPGA